MAKYRMRTFFLLAIIKKVMNVLDAKVAQKAAEHGISEDSSELTEYRTAMNELRDALGIKKKR